MKEARRAEVMDTENQFAEFPSPALDEARRLIERAAEQVENWQRNAADHDDIMSTSTTEGSTCGRSAVLEGLASQVVETIFGAMERILAILVPVDRARLDGLPVLTNIVRNVGSLRGDGRTAPLLDVSMSLHSLIAMLRLSAQINKRSPQIWEQALKSKSPAERTRAEDKAIRELMGMLHRGSTGEAGFLPPLLESGGIAIHCMQPPPATT